MNLVLMNAYSKDDVIMFLHYNIIFHPFPKTPATPRTTPETPAHTRAHPRAHPRAPNSPHKKTHQNLTEKYIY